MPPTDLLDGRLDLPPGFDLITLRESGDAFAHAKSIAGERGAGTVVHVGRFDLAEFAVVLEPEEALRTARRALYAGLAALADALASAAPQGDPAFASAKKHKPTKHKVKCAAGQARLKIGKRLICTREALPRTTLQPQQALVANAFAFQPGAGGSHTINTHMSDRSVEAKKPIQMARRDAP